LKAGEERTSPTLSVIIPVYNEAATLGKMIERVRAASLSKEIIVVDDGSTDGSRELLKEMGQGSLNGLRLLFHEKNLGKGAAIRTALLCVHGEITLIQDADLEYDPAEYPKLIEPILSGDADVVYGSRFLGGPHRVIYFWHRVGNGFLTLLSNLLTNLNLTDMETGYKVFRTDVLKRLPIRSDRFGFEPEVTVKAAKMGCRIYEVPISYRGRSYAEGKKITWMDGLRAVFILLKYWIMDDLGHAASKERRL